MEGLGSGSECRSLGLWVSAFWVVKLAKVGLAKVSQHSEILKLSRLAHDWPKSVKKLAKVCLAKVGHDPPRGL